jgi:hypothetical protein
MSSGILSDADDGGSYTVTSVYQSTQRNIPEHSPLQIRLSEILKYRRNMCFVFIHNLFWQIRFYPTSIKDNLQRE